MPTGVHLRDARRQLFDAAERVLLAGGPQALTSRAVTEEAGCAKGVLHRHFADFDTFLVELILDRAVQLDVESDLLLRSVGTGRVVDNVASALVALFGPVPSAIIPLITFRDDLRGRLRQARPGGGVGILGTVTTTISTYLLAERDRGRIAAIADIPSLTLSLVGGGHLLFADAESGPPSAATVKGFVSSALADVLVAGRN